MEERSELVSSQSRGIASMADPVQIGDGLHPTGWKSVSRLQTAGADRALGLELREDSRSVKPGGEVPDRSMGARSRWVETVETGRDYWHVPFGRTSSSVPWSVGKKDVPWDSEGGFAFSCPVCTCLGY